jgi:nicotinamide mononucleotide transporter
MDPLIGFFDVGRPLFSVLSYDMSAVEFFGTIFNLFSVYLLAHRRIAAWPIGIIGVGLFAVLFYQIRLYADCLEQIYYFGASLYGWWLWGRLKEAGEARVAYSPLRTLLLSLCVTLIGGLGLGWILLQLPAWLPGIFPEPPSYPYLDALTTSGSFVAMILEARRRLECWIYWTLLNVVGIGLYIAKGVPLVAALYTLYLGLAVYGWRLWLRAKSP